MIAGSPEAVEAAADAIERAAGAFGNAADDIGSHGRAVTADWLGSASDAAGAHIGQLATRTQAGADAVGSVPAVLRTFAGELRAAQRSWQTASDAAAAGTSAAQAGYRRQRAAEAMGDETPEAATDKADAQRHADQAVDEAHETIRAGNRAMADAVTRAERANDAAAALVDRATTALEAMSGASSTMAYAAYGGTAAGATVGYAAGWNGVTGAGADTPAAPTPPAEPEEEDHWWSWSGVGHTALDLVGLVPVVGEVADGANAVWYLAEGDTTSAALSAAAMIPIAGSAATVAKFGVKGVRAVNAASKGSKAVRAVEKDRAAMEEIGKAVGKQGGGPPGSLAARGGDELSGPVYVRVPPNASASDVEATRLYAQGAQRALEDNALSATGRVSTKGDLRAEASAAARAEGRRADRANTPYAGDVGHVPDTTWTGTAQPHSWQDLPSSVNRSLGGQARGYPIGYKPTEFIFVEP